MTGKQAVLCFKVVRNLRSANSRVGRAMTLVADAEFPTHTPELFELRDRLETIEHELLDAQEKMREVFAR